MVNNVTHRHTFMKMVQVQAGLGFGVKKDRPIFVFETQKNGAILSQSRKARKGGAFLLRKRTEWKG